MLALAAVMTSCSGGKSEADGMTKEEKAEKRVKDSLALKVGVMQTIDCLPAFLAKDEGIFDSLGVDVRLYHYTSMLDYDAALAKKRISGVYSDTKYVERLNKAVGVELERMKTFDSRWQLVANKRSRLHNVKQLEDKIVAVTRYSVADFLSNRMADSVKLGADKMFKVQVNDVDTRLKMLLNSEIDAAWLPEPQASVATALGCNVLASSDSRGERFSVLAFTSASLADKRVKSQIDLFLKGCEVAEQRIKKGGEKYYVGLVKRYYKYEQKTRGNGKRRTN